MAFFNYATMQMAAKIVYYGPGLCGKTTNLQYIYNKTSAKSRGEMVSLETESDRTLFFDLLPLEVGVIAGFKTRFQLYTVPGQVFYGETRRMVLKGVDGVVFVADSQRPMNEANIESLKDLEKNLVDMGLTLKGIPLVLQYNKRDLPNILTTQELDQALNWNSWPTVESSAVNGMGVFDTLKAISRTTLGSLKHKLSRPEPTVIPVAPPPAATVAPTAPAAVSPPPAIPARPAPPMAETAAIPGAGSTSPIPASIPAPLASAAASLLDVEFDTRQTKGSDQELATTAPKVKTVSVTARRVASELDRIRESLLGPLLAPTQPKVKDLAPALEDIRQAADQAKRAEADIVVEVPFELLQNLEGIHLSLQIMCDQKRHSIPGGVLAEVGQLLRSGDGWVARLRLVPKKS
jgi:mutual gliding-motility protein MglA